MAKSQQQETLEVVSRRPGYRRRALLIVLILGLLLASGAYHLGLYQAGAYSDGGTMGPALRDRLSDLQKDNKKLQKQLTVLERGRAIDRQALEAARQEISELEQQLVNERSELAMFRTIVAPEESQTGLQIQRFSLEPSQAAGRWRYNLVLTQIGDNSRFQSGEVRLTVVGKQDGERRDLALVDLVEEMSEPDIRFRFRYFQRIQGVMQLPEGYTPLEVRVVVDPEGRRAETVERLYDWK
ncbi:MAG: DUF6776 family protein [Oleiphilaceae bacterium]|nr:DUF6776 family protein [Oleiphilaceae bacterium]